MEAHCIRVIALGNGHVDQSLNLGQDCISKQANALGKDINSSLLPPTMGK